VIMAIRKRLRLNQSDFAKLLNARQKMISQYECGRVKPSPPQIIKILRLARHESESLPLTSFLAEELGLNSSAIIRLIDAEMKALRVQDPSIEARLQDIEAVLQKLREQENRLEQTLASVKRAGAVLFTLAQMHGESMAVASGLYRSVCICDKIPHDEFTAELERLAAGGYVQIVRTSAARVKMGAAGYDVSNWIPHSAQPEEILFVKIQPLGLQLIEGTVSTEENPGVEAL